MKKFIVCTLFAMIILAACGEISNSREEIALPLSITANLKGQESEFQLIITESESIISFGENHALYGTELRFGEGVGRASVGDFTRDVDLDIFPAQKALITALKAVDSNKSSGIETENAIKYTIDEMTIMVYYDKDTEEIIGIGTEENGRSFDFDITALEPYEIQSDSAG